MLNLKKESDAKTSKPGRLYLLVPAAEEPRVIQFSFNAVNKVLAFI